MGRVYKPERCKSWYIDYWNAEGERVRKRISTNKRLAEEALRDAEHHRDRIRAGLETTRKDDEDILALWAAFGAHLVTLGRRPSTIKHYRELIPDFAAVVGAKKVRDLSPRRAAAYIRAKRDAGLSSRRINAGLTAMQTMLRWALRQGRIHENPLRYCQKVENRPVKHRRPLEDWEIALLLDKSPPHYRRLWVAFLTTGLRRNELVELRWKDIDFERGLLTVRAETCKVKREDYLPIAPELDAVLRAIRPDRPDPNAHVFVNSWGRPWRNNLWRRFRLCVKTAGLNPDGLDIHSLRQTYGTMLAADPRNDVRTVMSLMRHTTVAMTMNLYAKPRAMRQRDAMNTLNLSNRGKLQASNGTCAPQLKKA